MSAHDTDGVPDLDVAWNFVLLHGMACYLQALAHEVEVALDGFAPRRINAGADVVVSRDQLDRVTNSVALIRDLAEITETVDAMVQRQETAAAFSAREVVAAAAMAIREGTADPQTVILSSSLLLPSIGLPALADGIGGDPDVVARWGDMRIRDLLIGFRGADAALVRRICAATQVHPDVEVKGLDGRKLERFTRVLREVARG
jgi:hypothetical protein